MDVVQTHQSALEPSPPHSPKQSANTWEIPPSAWTPRCHPLVEPISRDVDEYFLLHWNWPDEKSKKTFVAAGFSRVTCLYFPMAQNDRIALACKLLAVLFLIDDELEDMTLEEGKAYNDSLIAVSEGAIPVDPSSSAQVILHDVWKDMRDIDPELANSVLQPTFTFMRAQTDKERLNMKGLGNYLRYRERDVGKALLSALMRFSMGLHISTEEETSQIVRQLEQNCSRQISVVNDIYSFEKEYKASFSRNCEGAVLCSAVKLISDEASMDFESSKRVLWSMVREWEHTHDRLAYEVHHVEGREVLSEYVRGLEYQMSGNELWSRTTPRYHMVAE